MLGIFPTRRITRTCAVLAAVGFAVFLATRSTGPSIPPSVATPATSPSLAPPAVKPVTEPAEKSGLQSLPGDRYRTPAGLIFGPTRGEHRLEHVLRHCRDEPQRSGPHGVFDVQTGEEVAALIDEAYVLAREEPRRASVRRDGERTVYTIQMNRRIGYQGGQAGARARHPPCHQLTLVLEGMSVITAYPVR